MLVVSGVAFAEVQSLQRASVLGAPYISDTTGTYYNIDTAFIYAKFHVAGVAFAIISADVWACSAIVPGDNFVQTTAPIKYENTGGVALDFGFRIIDEDFLDGRTAPLHNWYQRNTWTDANVVGTAALPDNYVLGIVIVDDAVTSVNLADFADNDVLTTTLTYYTTAGQFKATTAGAYSWEGPTSLRLRAGPAGEDIVNTFFRFRMSDAGALDIREHAARIGVYARLAVD